MQIIDREKKLVDLLHRLGTIAHETDSPTEALQLSIDAVVRYFESGIGRISIYNPNNARLEIEASVGLPEDSREWKFPLGVGLCGWVSLYQRNALIEDVALDQRYLRITDFIQSAIAVPLLDGESVLGSLIIEASEVGYFSEEHLKDLELIGKVLTPYTIRLWQLYNLRRKSTQYESIVDMVQKLSNRFELSGLLGDLAVETRNILGCEYCTLYLLDTSGKTLHLQSIAGPEGLMDYSEEIPLEDSSMGAAVINAKTVEVINLNKTEEHHLQNLSTRSELVGMLACPVIYEKRTIGILNAYTSKAHLFSNTEKRVFRALADVGAIAIESTRLYGRIIETETSLRDSERLTTLGLLSAEIAHEIRNPLTVIKLLVESLTLDNNLDEAKLADIHVIIEKIDQLGEIVSRVLNFGKPRKQLFAHWDLNKIVEESLQLVRYKLIRSNIKYAFYPSDHALLIHGNRGQIQQVLLNLIINAEEAMQTGGSVLIETELETIDEVTMASVVIRDTGSGIGESIQGDIFESFLSDKPQGTGLGLAIAKRILKDHRGDIELMETSEKGTTFRFWLPFAS